MAASRARDIDQCAKKMHILHMNMCMCACASACAPVHLCIYVHYTMQAMHVLTLEYTDG